MANPSYSRLAGASLFFGAAQFLLSMIAAEALYPGYSTSKNYISDLGVGQAALLFNSSITLFGLCVLAGAYFKGKDMEAAETCGQADGASGKAFPVLLSIAGIGACGVGIFPETAGALHLASAAAVFFFGAASALYAGIRTGMPPPFSWFSIALGTVSLAALASTLLKADLFGLGLGGMERMIAYPIIAWCLAYSGMLSSKR